MFNITIIIISMGGSCYLPRDLDLIYIKTICLEEKNVPNKCKPIMQNIDKNGYLFKFCWLITQPAK